ncbi:putative cytosolic iron-sulfur protein assembly protein CIAO1 isoform X1 [Eretmochelys imbricata]
MKDSLSLLARIPAHPDSRCWFLAWDPSGTLLASCGGDRSVRIWGKEGREPLPGWACAVSCWVGMRLRPRKVKSQLLLKSPGSWEPLWPRAAASRCALAIGKATCELGWEGSSGCQAPYSSLTSLLSSALGDSWVCKSVLGEGHQRTIRKVAWSPCGSYLASASFDATTCIWKKSQDEFECVTTLEGHENEVKSVSWAPSGSLLATGSRDKSVWVWEVDEEDEYECVSVLNAHTQDVKHVVWHPNQELLASASYDDTVKLYREEEDDWVCCATLEGHESTVWSLAFDQSGERLASCSDDKTVRIWHQYKPGNEQGVVCSGADPSWKCICTLSGFHTRTIYDVAWCRLTGALATACGDDAIRIFEEEPLSNPQQPTFALTAHMPRAHSQDVNCVAWNPKEPGLLASCSDDGEMAFWKYQRPEVC